MIVDLPIFFIGLGQCVIVDLPQIIKPSPIQAVCGHDGVHLLVDGDVGAGRHQLVPVIIP